MSEQSLISVCIPTYNRAALWRRGLLWQSLREQTDLHFEVLICDDGSTDDTLEVLRATTATAAFPVRIFQTVADKVLPTQASGLPDNVMFLEARGGVLIHADDDGWLHPRLVEHVRSKNLTCRSRAIFGHNIFIDPATMKPYADTRQWFVDSRLARKLAPKGGESVVTLADNACWGALWACQTSLIRWLGGHDLQSLPFRGCDSRLGAAVLNAGVTCLFSAHEAMAFHHIGIAWQAEQMMRHNFDAVWKLQRTPYLLNCDQGSASPRGELVFRANVSGRYRAV